MNSHEVAISISKQYQDRDLNEADTRHQVIDPIIHDVLCWPRNRVSVEEYVAPGYADYILKRSDDAPILCLEAKKEGTYFNLPITFTNGNLCTYIKVKTLLTDNSIKLALNQVRTYCLDIGCDVGAITNGHEWVFFKTFQKEGDWKNLNAFVVCNLSYFAEKYIEAHNYLSFIGISEQASLRKLLMDKSFHNRELFYPKNELIRFDAPVDANNFASSLRPIADNYFGVIDVENHEFMDSCYVSDREYELAFQNARRRLEDAITPYLEQYDIQQFKDSDDGGIFGKRLTKNVLITKATDVVVLFGGKGVGKSTFLKKLFFHKPPQILKKNAVVALIDLIDTPHDHILIRNEIWNNLITCLDVDKLLISDREKLCYLFADKYDQAQKQDLCGLNKNSENYNIKLNQLIADWKKDLPYVALTLANYWRVRHKVVITVIDNTDQYNEELQEMCFTIAQEISSKLSCLVVISMREEKFHSSSIHGVLDAYQNSGFHITPPEPKQVFLRRIDYVLKLLRSENNLVSHLLSKRTDKQIISNLFQLFKREFSSKNSRLESFLTACSHGNIRFSLELFRGFLVSGYTNVREMTSVSDWKIQIHQVIKPFVIPERFFYEESKSKIPNVFQIRAKKNGSHFTALRILSKLLIGQDSKNPAFMPVASLAFEFKDIFNMKEDFDLNMGMLLTNGLIESNNRLEQFDELVDSVRITAYGEFILNTLHKAFTYFELICIDCALSNSSTSHSIASLSINDYEYYYQKDKRFERITKRLEKADVFLKYLENEEERERDIYKTHDYPFFTKEIRHIFENERQQVLKSATRNIQNHV